MEIIKFGKKTIGTIGETAACAYLKLKGHTLISRNLRVKRGEIDILTIKDGILHITEVKTMTGASEGSKAGNQWIQPEDNFSRAKMKRLRLMGFEILSMYPNNRLFRDFYESFETLTSKGETPIIKVLVPGEDPAIQIDGIAIRLSLDGKVIKKVTARYYPCLI
jgi:putative endonuclease